MGEGSEMNPIKITLQKIKDADACHSGWEKILAARGGDNAIYGEGFDLSLALESNGLSDTLWALRCLPEYGNLWRKYAVWCARQVKNLMTDQRSIDALDVAWRYSEGMATGTELAAARVAAWAAVEAAARTSAAVAARTAAEASARTSAWAAAEASAGAAAWAAAEASAWASAEAAHKEKLKQILDAGEWVEARK
jgi:hypothetical protein